MSGAGLPSLRDRILAITDALRRGERAQALAWSDQVVSGGFDDPDLLLMAGQYRIETGRLQEALAALTHARELAPTNIETLDTLGICLTLMGQPRAAVAAFDDALALGEFPVLRLHRAHPLEDAGRLQDAEADLEQVLAAEPQNLRALERAANLAVRRGQDPEGARLCRPRAGADGGIDAFRHHRAGRTELAERNFEEAQSLIAPLAQDDAGGDAINQSIANQILGDALDGQDRIPEAFAAYSQARYIMRMALNPLIQAQESAVLASMPPNISAPPIRWTGAPRAYDAPVKTHVFLVGFPRSGTTLLEQALASHSDVRSMEEVDCLGDAVGQFFHIQGGLAAFAALGDGQLAELRARYWQGVAAAGIATDRTVFVDKMPLNSIHQGFIARLFPEAKILFALRDPRDVVLSCFRRRLVMTSNTYELSRLDGAAAFYAATMELSEIYRRFLSLPRLDLRQEDMVADFEGEMRRACDFLGLSWQEGLRDFAALSRGRDVKTPSAAQVARGLNRDGIGQWRRYREQMTQVLPLLAPWVARFGYEEN